jgi:glycerophosphoryl diester phosphodiesterase
MNWPYPLWIAHRGAGRLAPENTLAAFRHGAGFGYRAFECDVKLSRDGQPFLLHDATLERTTDGQGVAGEQEWAALSRLDAGGWHSRAYAGEPLPTLEAIAGYVLRNGFVLNVEIKPTPGTEGLTGAVVSRRCAQLWATSRTPPVAPPLLTSFQSAALQAALAAQPELPRGLLLEHWPADCLAHAQALQCSAVVAQYALLDRARIEALHAAGMKALAYTVNDPAEARRLIALGIDGLITDAVDHFSPGPGVHD